MVTASLISRAAIRSRLRIKLSSAFLSILLLTAFVLCHTGSSKNYVTENIDPLSPLQNKCFDTAHLPSWWSYIWCFRHEIWQRHRDDSQNIIESRNFIGKFVPNESHLYNEVYKHNASNCLSASGLSVLRHAKVIISCCRGKSWSVMHDRFESVADLGTFIESVTEVNLCEYHLKVCSDLICPSDSDQSDLVQTDFLRTTNKFDTKYISSLRGFSDFVMEEVSSSQRSGGAAFVAVIEQSSNLERVRNMFHYGYDMYMQYAQPESELRPLSCDGGSFDLVKIPLVTLIDTLDTLVIMGNHTEFRRAVGIVCDHYGHERFNLDVNVSVFETTIRILGGLLAAHLMAIDPLLGIYNNYRSEGSDTFKEFDGNYDNELMRLALDLGERLLPAFATPTGIPYGTVNLRYGVPVGETEIASTAGAGSLLVEFEVLSALSNDQRFGDAAFLAVQALYSRRSYLGLLGKHIHTSNGQWHESTSGIGSNADSFYEYLLKGHLLTQRGTLFAMFTETYRAVKRHIQVGDWFTEVDMFNGKSRRNRVENLQAFWPGMESSLGLCDSAARLLNTFYAVWDDIGFLPEEFDQAAWLDNKVISNSWYPLRPELIESTYHQYRSTGDRTWLSAGATFLDALENNTKTECGFASVSNIATMQLTNSMPSYFLSETCKYLYLLFDQDNFVHDRPYIFSTEAHPFDPLQLPMRLDALRGSTKEVSAPATLSHPLPLRCQKGLWWDSSSLGYDAEYVRDQQRKQSTSFKGNADTLRGTSYSSRRTTAVLNSAKIAALLHSSSLPDVHDGAGAPDAELTDWVPDENNGEHPDTCYDGDAVLQSPSPEIAETPASYEKQPTPQKITVQAQTLGEFDVSVYPDGFVVVSKEHGDTIEISNIGESVVFVGYVWGPPDSQSKAFITDHLGRTVTCTVGLVDGAGEPLSNDEERSCSIAMFGPESLPQFPIVAELHVPPPGNEMVCKSLESPLSSAVDVMRSKDLLESPESQKSWWREWPSATSISSMLSLRYLKTGSNSDSESEARVVLARRGDCLFEDKTLIAQNAGAAAVLIANNEDFLFIMSGKRKSGEKRAEVLVENPPATASEGVIMDKASGTRATIPTVMITKSDAHSLISALSAASEGTDPALILPVRTRISLATSPGMLDSSFMGGKISPKLRVSPRIIHVLGGEIWGIVLDSLNGREWQLYIMAAADVAASIATIPWLAITTSQQPVSTSYTGTLKPVNLYYNMLARHCPAHLGLDGDQVVISKL